jgi:hypothetical protein
MFKVILYKPAKGKGWVAKRKVPSRSDAKAILDDAAESWAGELVEVKDDFLMNKDGDWIMMVELAA